MRLCAGAAEADVLELPPGEEACLPEEPGWGLGQQGVAEQHDLQAEGDQAEVGHEK